MTDKLQSDIQKLIELKTKTLIDGIHAQREEILSAFVAKYGFEPDRAMQVIKHSQDGTTTEWYIRQLTDEEYEQYVPEGKHIVEDADGMRFVV